MEVFEIVCVFGLVEFDVVFGGEWDFYVIVKLFLVVLGCELLVIGVVGLWECMVCNCEVVL